MQETDAQLARRAQQADSKAFAEIVRRYERRIFGLVYRLLGDYAQSSDVTQEAFLRAYQNLGRFDEERPLMPWLATIALDLAWR